MTWLFGVLLVRDVYSDSDGWAFLHVCFERDITANQLWTEGAFDLL